MVKKIVSLNVQLRHLALSQSQQEKLQDKVPYSGEHQEITTETIGGSTTATVVRVVLIGSLLCGQVLQL